MADRTVTYNFRGDFSSLAAGLTAAGRGVTDLGVKMTALDKNGAKMRAGLTSFGSTAGKVGLIAAAGFAVAVTAAAKFEQSMSNVSAATHETSGNMELLRQAAIDAGQATKFSATEAAGAIEALAKAGVSTTDILGGGLSGALDLAAAGNLEVADAAEIAATALTQFKLAGEDVPHVADLLAAGAGKAQGEVSDLSMALKQSGLVASQMGVSIEDTVGTLSAFASAGLLGSDAGTSFKSMLQALTPNSKKAADEMEALGLHFYDAQGQFVGLEEVAGQLQTALGGLSEEQRNSALETIFGSDAVRAASVLYSQGAQGISDWTDKVNDQGYAAETAAIKMDNLSGDLEQLKGSLETAFIGAGSGSQGPLRQLVQGVTDVVNAFNKLPESGQSAATGLLAVTAVLGGGLWFTSKIVQGVASTRQALDDLGWSAQRTQGALANIGRATVGIAAVIGTLDLLQAAMNKLTDSDIDASGLGRDLEALADGRITDNLDNLFQTFQDIDDGWQADANPLSWISSWDPSGAEAAEKNIKAIDAALASMVESGDSQMAADAIANMAPAAEKAGLSVRELTDLFPEYGTAIANASGETAGWGGFVGDLAGHILTATSATQGGEEATSGFGVVTRQAAEAAQAEAAALAEATKAMQDKTSATLAAFDAETGYRQALKDARGQADKNNAGIKGSTEAALSNRAALSQLAGAWNNQSASVKNNVERYRESRKAFIDTATAMGVPTAAAKKLADQILQIPKSKVSNVSVNGADAAISKVQTLNRELSKVVSKTITVTVNKVGGAVGNLFADGGFTGAGGKNEPAGIVHRGEVVIPQSLVKRDWGMLSSRYGHLPGFAGGGVVGGGSSGNGSLWGLSGEAAAAAESLANLNSMSKKTLTQRERFLTHEQKLAEKAMDAAQERVDEEKAALRDLKDARKAFADSVSGNFMSSLFGDTDLVAAIRDGLLPSETLRNIKGTGDHGGITDEDVQKYLDSLSASQIAMLQAQANSGILGRDTRGANQFTDLLKQLRGLGLNGGAFRELAASGNIGQAQFYASMTPDQIAQFEQDYRDRNRAAQGAGRLAGDSEFGRSVRQQTRAAEKAVAIQHEIRDEQRKLNQLSKSIDKRLEQLNRTESAAPKETGKEVAGALNKAAADAARKAKG